MKWLIKLLFGRAVFVFLAMTLQVLVLGAIILKFLDAKSSTGSHPSCRPTSTTGTTGR